MSKSQSISCDIHIASLEYWEGKDFYLEPNSIYTMTIDYPFNVPLDYKIKTNESGMGFVGVLHHVRKAYDKQYASVDTNPEQDYWHGIEDLVIEGIKVNHVKKTIELSVGS